MCDTLTKWNDRCLNLVYHMDPKPGMALEFARFAEQGARPAVWGRTSVMKLVSNFRQIIIYQLQLNTPYKYFPRWGGRAPVPPLAPPLPQTPRVRTTRAGRIIDAATEGSQKSHPQSTNTSRMLFTSFEADGRRESPTSIRNASPFASSKSFAICFRLPSQYAFNPHFRVQKVIE
ncbi:hypothetical protein AVEN_263546-1 [Araneus ventricosus]|uniref:Uncharacterized protein n=1 Tax=Araneus ventricosus TaxID=182803 RepID=A0A4Y2PFM7_ARAVE|nr:hypothetical protein AVEN_263546-1 [Araneus ventricosus]